MRLSLNDQITLTAPQRIWSRSGEKAFKKPPKWTKMGSPPEKPDASENKIPSVFCSFKSLYHEKELQCFACLI